MAKQIVFDEQARKSLKRARILPQVSLQDAGVPKHGETFIYQGG